MSVLHAVAVIFQFLSAWLSVGCLVVAAMNRGEERTHWLLSAVVLMLVAQ